MNKALIICSEGQRSWIEPAIGEALDGIYETEIMEGPEWNPEDLIILTAAWNEVGSTDLLCSLLKHTTRGGSLLVVGDGMLAGDCYEIKLLTGRSLLRELPWGQISIHMEDLSLAKGAEDFETWDTPVFFQQDVFDRSEIVASFGYGKKQYEAAWHKDWFRGHVYCLSMGRTRASLNSFLALIRNYGSDAAERGKSV